MAQYALRGWWTVSKALLQSRQMTSTAFSSSTRWVTWSVKEIRLVRQDLPWMNPCWLALIPWLSFTCLVSALRMNRSTILHILCKVQWKGCRSRHNANESNILSLLFHCKWPPKPKFLAWKYQAKSVWLLELKEKGAYSFSLFI